MRSLIIITLLFPIVTAAQINRSAREFAGEQVQEYVTKKLFKGMPYKPVSFGPIKEHKEKNTEIAWLIEHKFEISEKQSYSGRQASTPRTYRFYFYLDERMKVLRAETYQED